MALPAPSIATVGVRVLPQVAGFQARLSTGLTDPLRVAGIAALAATAGLVAGLTSIGVVASKSFFKVEESLAKIVGLVGVAQDQVDVWETQLAGLSQATAQGPAELAEALFFVTSAGIRGTAAMETLEASARAATAGLGSTKQVADAVTSAMNAYGPANLSAAAATDVLVATVREGKVEADAVAGSLGRVIPIAAELGVSFGNVGAALAAMTRLGLSAEESTTALRGIFNAILKPSAQAKDTLADFGLSASGLREQLKGGEGLLDLLLTLKARFGENDEALSRVFPRVRGLVGVLSLVGQNADQAEGIFARMANTTGDLDKAFDAVANTSGFAIKQALAEIQGLLVDLGSEILPDVAAAVQELTPLFRDQLVPAIKLGVDIVANIIFGFQDLVVLFSNLPGSVKRVTLGVIGLSAALAALNVHPIIAVLTGVATAIAVIGDNARENKSEVQRIVDDLLRLDTLSINTIGDIIGKVPDKDLRRLDEIGIGLGKVKQLIESDAFSDGEFRLQFQADAKAMGLAGADAAELTSALLHLQNQYNDAETAVRLIAEANAKAAADAISHKDALLGGLAAAEGLDPAMFGLASSTDAAAAAAGDAAGEYKNMEQVVLDAKAAVDDFIAAQLRAADPAFNLVSSRLDLEEAKSDLADARKATGDDRATPAELEALVLKVLQSQAKYDAATQTFVVNQTEALGAFDELVDGLGLSLDATTQDIRDALLRIQSAGQINFSSIGFEIKNGILFGLGDLAQELEDELVFQIQSGKSGAKTRIGILSPSRVFADEIGVPIAQGIAAGITKGSREIDVALINATRPRGGGVGAGGKGGFTQNITVNNPSVKDVDSDVQKAGATARTLALMQGGALR